MNLRVHRPNHYTIRPHIIIFMHFLCYLHQSNMDSKFAEQYLQRVYTALHAANKDHVYLELISLLNDFGEKEKTAKSVPQV